MIYSTVWWWKTSRRQKQKINIARLRWQEKNQKAYIVSHFVSSVRESPLPLPLAYRYHFLNEHTYDQHIKKRNPEIYDRPFHYFTIGHSLFPWHGLCEMKRTHATISLHYHRVSAASSPSHTISIYTFIYIRSEKKNMYVYRCDGREYGHGHWEVRAAGVQRSWGYLIELLSRFLVLLLIVEHLFAVSLIYMLSFQLERVRTKLNKKKMKRKKWRSKNAQKKATKYDEIFVR